MRILAIISLLLVVAFSAKNKEQPTQNPEKGFNTYLNKFKPVDLPYSIGADDFFKLTRKPLSQEIEHENLNFIPYKRPIYSRMGPDDYTHEVQFALNNNYRAVIVGGKRTFGERPNYYHLITYTPKGEVIAYKKIAWAYGKREIGRCHISPSGEVTMEHCSNHLDKNGDIAGTDIEETEVFLLTDTGDIVAKETKLEPIQLEVKQEQNPRASLDW